MRKSQGNGERGDTLVELMMAVVVMGTAVIAVVGGVAVSIRMSDIHRKQAAAGAHIRDFAEEIETSVSATPSGYIPCAVPAIGGVPGTYDGSPSTYPSFTRETTAVDYWNGSAFGNTCTAATDSGVQRVSLRITSADTRVSEVMVIIVRKPCRSTIDFPLETACS